MLQNEKSIIIMQGYFLWIFCYFSQISFLIDSFRRRGVDFSSCFLLILIKTLQSYLTIYSLFSLDAIKDDEK